MTQTYKYKTSSCSYLFALKQSHVNGDMHRNRWDMFGKIENVGMLVKCGGGVFVWASSWTDL